MRIPAMLSFVSLTIAFVCTSVIVSSAQAASCSINGGAKYTRDPIVTVSYDIGWYSHPTEYAISNGTYPGTWDDWYSIPAFDHSIRWNLCEWGLYGGEKTVCMCFRESSEDSEWEWDKCSDSIILDVEGPFTLVWHSYVKRGRTARIRWEASDSMRDGSGVKSLRLTITRRGKTVKRKTYSWRDSDWGGAKLDRRGTWRFRCRLRKGTYAVRAVAYDFAGNRSTYKTTLRVGSFSL